MKAGLDLWNKSKAKWKGYDVEFELDVERLSSSDKPRLDPKSLSEWGEQHDQRDIIELKDETGEKYPQGATGGKGDPKRPNHITAGVDGDKPSEFEAVNMAHELGHAMGVNEEGYAGPDMKEDWKGDVMSYKPAVVENPESGANSPEDFAVTERSMSAAMKAIAEATYGR